jgi:hypothetical protein
MDGTGEAGAGRLRGLLGGIRARSRRPPLLLLTLRASAQRARDGVFLADFGYINGRSSLERRCAHFLSGCLLLLLALAPALALVLAASSTNSVDPSSALRLCSRGPVAFFCL